MSLSRIGVRTRLAVGLTLSTVMITLLVGVVTAALAFWRADDPDTNARAGAAQVEGVTVVVVADDGADSAAADARRDALGWMLVALGAAIVPSLAVAWVVSARLMGTVDTALADVEATARERQRRLDEVIHELRTPLAVAGTNLELAAEAPSVDEDTARLIDAARRAADRMRRTVDDLAEHGRLSVSRSDSLDLGTELRAVAAEHMGPARARSIHLRAAGATRLQVPAGDRAAVRTTLGNLTSNAVRLAPGGSTITLSCGEYRGWAWAAVSDEGPGISPRLHAHVFARGWRGRHDHDRDRTAQPGQRGLGLTISRQITEAHGGVLTIESDEGFGTTFTVWLPVDPEAAASAIVTDDRLHPVARPWGQFTDDLAGVR